MASADPRTADVPAGVHAPSVRRREPEGRAGKTTTTVELAAAWAAAGLRVRVIDADHQEAALSVWLLPQYPEGARSTRCDRCSSRTARWQRPPTRPCSPGWTSCPRAPTSSAWSTNGPSAQSRHSRPRSPRRRKRPADAPPMT
ncbi:ParA family protein [Streptomyces sp. SID7958]|uniref:ParA family protein n=2 Tax=unclassified Streptomyces TaxID=2593676 RepID=A0A6G3QT05_9ACTN|nr:ParA family protein [Streptomyces sp. SID14436]NEC81092.1 ParA family protein [Streptomyces sp. SID7958]